MLMTTDREENANASVDIIGRRLASLAFYCKPSEAMFEAIDTAADKMPSPWKNRTKQVLSARTAEGGLDAKKLDGLMIGEFTAELEDMDPESILLAAYAAGKAYQDQILEANARAVLADKSLTIAERIEAVKGLSAGVEPANKTGLPLITSANSLCAFPIPEPAQIIKGVLHRGSKLVFGGPSKAFKSWNLIDLCLAVSTGGGWLGWPTMDGTDIAGRSLYVNLELQPFAVQRRINTLCDARGIEPPESMDVWNLRGTGASMTQILTALPDGAQYDLIVPDPVYKLYGADRKENDLSDMAAMMAEIEEMADITGAAVALGAHFAKGLASAKEHLDRVSGSGVFARDPDTFVTATPHQDEGCFSIELTARNFPPTESFVAEWTFPQMIRVIGKDPAALKKMGGRPAKWKTDDLKKHYKKGMSTAAWCRAVMAETGMSRGTFYSLYPEVKEGRDEDGWSLNDGE